MCAGCGGGPRWRCLAVGAKGWKRRPHSSMGWRQRAGRAPDVTSEAELEAAAATVQATWGGCQILVNNAGAAMVRPFLQTDTAALRGLLEVNLIGALLTARIFGAQLTGGWGA